MELRARLAAAARATRLTIVCGALLAALVLAPAARADDLKYIAPHSGVPRYHSLAAERAIAIANAQPKVRAYRRRHPRLRAYAYTNGPGRWQVSYFRGGAEKLQVAIADAGPRVLEVWTGWQVAWKMARGYPGAFGGRADALYVWLPLCALFLLPFVDFRRPLRLLHLDLLVLLGFGVSLAFFNHAHILVSVPLVYPALVYVLVRMLVAGLRPRARAGPIVPHVPIAWLALALVFLAGFRIALNLADSSVIDVGYASVVGAHRIVMGHGLYGGGFPQDVLHGDTYAPVAYLAYIPFERLFGFAGRWDALAAAHAAAIAFDALTVAGLFVFGRRLRRGRPGLELGVALAFAWAAFPFTLFTLDSNSNDGLVAMLAVWALVALASPVARGALAALAGMTKFAPLAIVPLVAAGRGWTLERRRVAVGALAAAVVLAAVLVPFVPRGGLSAFYHRTIGYQVGRGAPFSIWGLHHSLDPLWTAVKAFAVALGALLLVLPRRRSPVQVAALGAAAIVAVELCASYWFYLYIVWFLPLALAALFGERSGGEVAAVEPAVTAAAAVAEPVAA